MVPAWTQLHIYNNYNAPSDPRMKIDSKRCSQLRAESIHRIYYRMNTMDMKIDQRSLRQDKAESLCDRGIQALVKGRMDEAETQFTLAARMGEPGGLLALGIEYEQGRSWNRNLRKAQYLYMQCLSYYHRQCETKDEFEAKTVSVTSQLTQVNIKINRQSCAVTAC